MLIQSRLDGRILDEQILQARLGATVRRRRAIRRFIEQNPRFLGCCGNEYPELLAECKRLQIPLTHKKLLRVVTRQEERLKNEFTPDFQHQRERERQVFAVEMSALFAQGKKRGRSKKAQKGGAA